MDKKELISYLEKQIDYHHQKQSEVGFYSKLYVFHMGKAFAFADILKLLEE